MEIAILISVMITTVIVGISVAFKSIKPKIGDIEINKEELTDNLAHYLSELFEEKQLFRNIEIPNAHGELVNIEILVVHNNGVYIFEPQQYKGVVYGGCGDTDWGCRLDKESTPVVIKNPTTKTYQKNTHIKQYLDIHNKYIYSYAIYSDEATVNAYGRTRIKIKNFSDFKNTFRGDMSVNNKNADFKEHFMQKTLEKLNLLLKPV
jgi:hypothetical protein